MGMKQSGLSDALFSKTQRRVLGLLFGHPERSFYSNEIVRAARAGVGAVQRELGSLAAAGLVTVSRLGNQKHYQVNRGSPIFGELRSIVAKVLGTSLPAATVLQQPQAQYAVSARPAKLHIPTKKIAAMCRKYGVRKLSLFGSAARGELTRKSDIDLMVEFKPGEAPSLWDGPDMQKEFSALFDGRRVDLVPPGIMRNPYRRKTIAPDLQVIYEA